jgi:uncharacterized membrane protein
MDKTIHEKIEELTLKVQELARQQSTISSQLLQLIDELEALKRTVHVYPTVAQEQVVIEKVEVREVPVPPPPPAPPPMMAAPAPRSSSSFEEFIGKNVASKVGILVTIIGIFIGAKYAIEHNMVSPVVRVINGYIAGIALVGVAMRLKKKYEAYSSVLMGGGLAVLYFITYIAYSFYQLLPQPAAFALMLVFTAATVYAALLYNRVIIAHLAQVGAYAIPFLLSDNSGRYAVFFGYIAIINTGILIVSLRKYWKTLFYTAFVLTWFIYGFWYDTSFDHHLHKLIAWTYLTVFFLLFYATFLAYKIIKKEQYELHDVFVLLGNAFIFYGIGYNLISYETAGNYAGAFTLANAVIHLVISQVIRRLQLADRSLYYLLLGLVIVFCTIAIPVQLDGNWVTLLWTAEAVLVFLIGRMRQAGAYEKLGAGLTILSFLSLVQDWFTHAGQFTLRTGSTQPFINIIFATGLLVAIAQAVMIVYNRDEKYRSALAPASMYLVFYDYVLPAIFLVTAYFIFNLEITGYFNRLELANHETEGFYNSWGSRIGSVEFIVLLLYSMVFDLALMLLNKRWAKNRILISFALTGVGIMLFILLLFGLDMLNNMARAYYQKGAGYFGALELYLRYIVMAVTALLFYVGQQGINEFIPEPSVKRAWTLAIYGITLSFISAEYLCWTSFSGAGNQYKLGLSIIWGVYALLLIVLGIQKKQKHLRLAAIALFLVTLLKLFFYDLAGSGTITKTISFISLGVLLLVMSFLYNKYKEVLFGDGGKAGEE